MPHRDESPTANGQPPSLSRTRSSSAPPTGIAARARSRAPTSEYGGDSDSDPDSAARYLGQKYLLKVTAGPSYDEATHSVVHVNSGAGVLVENEFLTARVSVRIKGYRGLPRGSPETSAYFAAPVHAKDRYGIGFSFVPKQALPGADAVWGNDFDRPIRDRLPPGFNYAFRLVKGLVDPGLACDAYADVPWVYGPALSGWFALRVGESQALRRRGARVEVDAADVPSVGDDSVLVEGADGSGAAARERYALPADAAKRRKFFLNKANLARFEFEAGRLYQGEYYTPYADFSDFSVRLPGFSISVLKYMDDKTHTLRWVFKNRATGDVYFCVVLTMLFGQDIIDAVAEDDGAGLEHSPSDVD